MKKFLALLLVMMLIMTGFTACGSKDDAEGETPDVNMEQDVETDAEADADAESDADAEADKTEEKEESVKEEEKEEEKEEAADKKDEQKPAESKPAESKPAESKPEADKEEAKEESKPEEQPSGGAAVSGTPAEIIEKIYGQHPVADLPLGTMEVDLADPDAVKMFTGLSGADKIEAAAVSESMMGAQAYSLIVVKVKDAADAEAVASEMMNGIDPRKWVCVEADDMRDAAAGDVVVLMMVSSEHADVATAKGIIDAFGSVAGGLDLNMSK